MRRVLLTLGCLVGCKEKATEPPPAPPPPVDGVTLIQPGVAPFAPLRYRFTRGTKTASELRCDFAITSDGQGDAMPTLVVELETTVEDVLADGAAKLRITLTRARLQNPPPGDTGLSELAQAQAAAMQGAVITEVLGPDGKISGARVEPAGDVTAPARAQLTRLVESIEHVAMQLPVEPVGVGATWRQRRTLPPGGIRGVAEIVYTMTSRTDTSFAYTSAGQLTGGSQTLDREGVTIEVTNTRGHSDGKGRVELVRYALEVDVTSVFTATMTAVAPKDTPGSGSSTIEITMATRMTPATPAAADAAAASVAAGSADGSDAGSADGSAAGADAESDDEHPAAPAPAGGARRRSRAAQGAHDAP